MSIAKAVSYTKNTAFKEMENTKEIKLWKDIYKLIIFQILEVQPELSLKNPTEAIFLDSIITFKGLDYQNILTLLYESFTVGTDCMNVLYCVLPEPRFLL